MKRYALVFGTPIEAIVSYMPGNYRVIWTGEHPPYEGATYTRPAAVVAGQDEAGWTLDGYVIPRLASGLYGAVEIDLSHPVMKAVPV